MVRRGHSGRAWNVPRLRRPSRDGLLGCRPVALGQLWPNFRSLRCEACSTRGIELSLFGVAVLCSLVAASVRCSWPPVRAPRFVRVCFLPTIVPPVTGVGRWSVSPQRGTAVGGAHVRRSPRRPG
ncbi:hypothetical protein SVEN_6872 [Streptomyces venezuelae ATCC 10712]|uniref:Uncharacterized protein n=1 Tax=Streptomyces venezuelae (strain ATCC 10712 / CBS 650.69 / DSM 40230 / JCM 4526 / NBRC 13096 / PD 04745) TaxID=953739 RepID=F2RJ32_STRVP|nr:hypothetical protein SVEN_6872 [Streptomyces venezuelae ATCC 10712]